MEIRYQRELKRNYLIIKPDNNIKEGYELHMIDENVIEGLLRMNIKYVEEELLYYYEITSKQPLSRLLENRGMRAAEIQKLILGIGAVIDRIEGYLLKEKNIWLDPDYIYIEPEEYQVYLCLVPGMENDFPKEMEKLLQYLLGKIDHKDREGVVLAYGLFQESQKENYGMRDLLKIISGAGEREDIRKSQRQMQEKNEIGEAEEKEEIKTAYEEEWPAESYQKGPQKNRGCKKKNIIYMFIMSAGILSAAAYLFLKKGVNNKAVIQAALIVTVGIIILLFLKGTGEEKKPDDDEQIREKTAKEKRLEPKSKDFWMMQLEEEEDGGKKEIEEIKEEAEKVAPSNDTTLLADLSEKKEDRKLISLDKEEEIRILYYPFLIGKQEGLVDYVLNYDTVSRLHVRIDIQDGKYKITDLNSTNGTSVKGHMLEANESMGIVPGDEVYIADKGFLFV